MVAPFTVVQMPVMTPFVLVTLTSATLYGEAGDDSLSLSEADRSTASTITVVTVMTP